MGMGVSLGGYDLGEVLGRGGMSTVYAATDADGVRRAVKVLADEGAGDALARARFEREARVTAALEHPNVVRVIGQDVADARPWLALEFVGPDAETELRRGAITPRRAGRIVTAVAAALDAVAARGVVHGDVKPANILLGDGGRVVLSDFGAAVDRGDPAGRDPAVASLAYAAPEVIRGEAVDGRADVYALGCTMFRLLTAGRYPFPVDRGRAELARAHCEDPPPRVSDVVGWASTALDEVVATALAKDPADRYASAGQFAVAAAAAMEAPSAARPASAPASLAGRLESPARVRVRPRLTLSVPALSDGQRRTAAVAAAAAGVLAIVGVAWPSPPAASPPSPPPPAPTSSTPPTATADDLARLRRLLPSGYEPGVCTPAPLTAGVAAELSCGRNVDVAGATTGQYQLMSSATEIRPALEAVMASGTTVLCPQNMQSPGFWWRLADPREPAGTLWCGLRSGRPVIAWSTQASMLVSSIEGGDPGDLPALYAWWTQHS